MLRWLQLQNIEVISLDQLPARLASPRGPRFVCITFDDGYRDNFTEALPIFREFAAPFNVNITNGFISGTTSVWWYFLEQALTSANSLQFSWKGRVHAFSSTDRNEQNRALDEISGLIRGLGAERDELLRTIGEAAGVDPCGATRRLCLTWDELRAHVIDPLVTVGAHTQSHHSLNRLADSEIEAEVEQARAILAAEIGRPILHFAYPFGGANAVGEREFAIVRRSGFKTMLTTCAANLKPAHGMHPDRFPRITLSGNYPILKSLRLAASGLTAWREERRGRRRR
jgi:peptidoglycan/xylan/chitin deacetylase (PgdA/CDA1 family)